MKRWGKGGGGAVEWGSNLAGVSYSHYCDPSEGAARKQENASYQQGLSSLWQQNEGFGPSEGSEWGGRGDGDLEE